MRCSLAILSLCFLVTFDHPATALEPVAEDAFEKQIRPMLVKYCGDCHDPNDSSNPVKFLKSHTVADVATQRSVWKSVAAQLMNRTMPPPDDAQPPEDERLATAHWITQTLQATACQQGEFAGAVTTRRLNRHEYDNTLRDLLGVDLGLSESFPSDGGGGEGFDNNGETLFLPPILMERYLEAAQTALDAAIVTPRLDRSFQPADFVSEKEIEKDHLQLTAGATASCLINIYVEGEYDVSLFLQQTEDSKKRKFQLKVDGIVASRFNSQEPRLKTALHLKRGLHRITLQCQPESAPVFIDHMQVTQEKHQPSQEQLASHRLIFGAEPEKTADWDRDQGTQVLAKFLRRAFRRSVTEDEVATYLSLYDRAARRGDPFEERIKLALKGILVSPRFLFRIEPAPSSTTPVPIDDFSLASRLSYFLWASMPDDELLDLAAAGKLQDDQVLKKQVERMLDDPRARAFAFDFVGQWLGTREVGARIAPDTNVFRDEFTPELLTDMREQPVRLFEYVVHENRSLLEFISADYTLVNARLAKHYGFSDVMGKEFQRVEDPQGRRSGVLGLGGVQLATSFPNRTSPVLRGAWVLESLLGTPVPPPPPDVPPLKKRKKGEKLSFRETLEKHREHQSCAACHDIIDPIGFGLENYDVLGRWRDKENDVVIDASGVFPSGESFDGPAELKQVLLGRKDEFIHHLVEKMLGFALGRSLVDQDQCAVQQIADELKKNEYHAQVLIQRIVASRPFRQHQVVEPAATAAR